MSSTTAPRLWGNYENAPVSATDRVKREGSPLGGPRPGLRGGLLHWAGLIVSWQELKPDKCPTPVPGSVQGGQMAGSDPHARGGLVERLESCYVNKRRALLEVTLCGRDTRFRVRFLSSYWDCSECKGPFPEHLDVSVFLWSNLPC